MSSNVSQYLIRHFQHFNAATLVAAATAYRSLIENGGMMFLAMAGAMSTAEIGISLARMIRSRKIHAVCCTGANLEEDVFNLVAHDAYKRVPQYRDLSPLNELTLFKSGLNRVTDTCIPEVEAMEVVEDIIIQEWKSAEASNERLFPHEFLYRALRTNALKSRFQIDPADSWMLACMDLNVPIFVPGWEDSSLGNVFAEQILRGNLSNVHTVKTGMEYMLSLCAWYQQTSLERGIGFFQIGGGISGDFPICVVPLLRDDLHIDVPLWAYFCQVSDSTTSYGSYSGAVPNEKITWGKLAIDTPSYIVESDATIVAPLIFALVLDD